MIGNSRWRDVATRAIGVGLLGIAVATVTLAQPRLVPLAGDRQELGVPGQVNTAVQLATVGDTVTVVWTARAPDASAGDIMLAMSHDGGRTFSPPRRVNGRPGDAQVGGEQPPSVVLGSPEEVYVVWRSVQGRGNAIVAAHSGDGGHTFSQAHALHDTEQPGFRGFQSAAVSADGTLHVTWLDGRHADGPKRTPHPAPRQDVYYATWTPGSPPREVPLQADVCFCCKTAIGVSPDGQVSLAWRHIYPGSIRDIAFVRQVDGRFGTPARVSEDHWELAGCPDDGPSFAIDSRGETHLVWPTVVQDPSPAKTVFYASSTDGTEFSRRLAIPRLGGDTMSHPQITLEGHGRPVVVWDEMHDGQRRVGFTYRTTVDAGDFGAPISLDSVAPAQYPDVAPIPGGVLVAWTSGSLRGGSLIALRPITLP